jgi:anthranilate synthase/aminodeoxychorismate synthase-like glutamine amidotransferase
MSAAHTKTRGVRGAQRPRSTVNVLVVDNYDSFTFNLVQHLGELGAVPDVHRNDAITIDDVADMRPDAVVISPGPGTPDDAGVSADVVSWCASNATPLLGVCLGHQVIAQAFGARVERVAVMHGKKSLVSHDGRGVLAGLDDPFEAMRYHSLAVVGSSVPDVLDVTAWTPEPVIMGLRHTTLPIEGVQFHPESIGTPLGKRLLSNFVASLRRVAR